MQWSLDKEIDSIRSEFPILEKCVYLISNSLGAVPKKAQETLLEFYRMWAEEGVGAWQKKWWELSQKTGDQLASFLGAGEEEVTMMANATHCHWVILSTKFLTRNEKRNKIVMTDQDFPSILYAVSKISAFMGW